MDDTIQAIIDILNETENYQLSELLNHSGFELIESGSFGSRVNSVKSTAIILSPPKFNARITNLSSDEREKIINALFQIFPIQDNAPEITEVIFKADIKSSNVKPTTSGIRPGSLDDDGNFLDEEEPELEMVDGYFLITKETFEKNVERNKRLQHKYFEFEHDYINYFPDSFWELEHLEHISFKDCKIELLPSDILKLEKLDFIVFEESIIDVSPDKFHLPSKARILQFVDCKLIEFPSAIGQLKDLESLELSNSKIKHLPDVFSKLKKLEELDLSDNEIAILPDSFSQLSSLTTLNLVGNRLSAFPESILDLRNLEEIYLSYNRIDSIPYEIDSLSKLERLHLDNNELRALPTSISSLKGISSLPLEDNPFTDMPEIKDKTQVEVYYYLDELAGKRALTTEWEIPESFRVAFQQYLSYFSEFVQRLHGEQIVFEAHKTAIGLRLITEPTDSLPIQRINELLELYMNQNVDFTPPTQGYSSLSQEVGVMHLKSDLKLERQQLNFKIEHQADKLRLYERLIEEKNNEIKEARITIRYFQDTLSPALLQLMPASVNSSNHSLKLQYDRIEDKFKELETKLEGIAQILKDDTQLMSQQRAEAFVAMAEVMDKIQQGVKPDKTSIEKLTSILKGMKELSGLASQLLTIWKQS